MSINHGETIRPVSDHKTTEEGKRNAEVLYWGDEMSDMEQHNSSLWQGKRSGKGPGLGQKEQHPRDCGWEGRKGAWESHDGAGFCLLLL